MPTEKAKATWAEAGATEGPMLRVLLLGTLVTLAVALVSGIAGPRDLHSDLHSDV